MVERWEIIFGVLGLELCGAAPWSGSFLAALPFWHTQTDFLWRAPPGLPSPRVAARRQLWGPAAMAGCLLGLGLSGRRSADAKTENPANPEQA
jgi:hypothetical protein